MRIMRFVGPTLCLFFLASGAQGDDWPRFRGPRAAGVSGEAAKLPDELGLKKNLLWKVSVGKGHSSPVVIGQRIFLTSFEGEKLLTISFDSVTGKRLWEATAPYSKLERVHRIGSVATPSVAADADRVVSFFGSSGIFAYDHNGKSLWQVKLGPFDNSFGSAGSVIIHDDLVVTVQDHDTGSFVAAYDKESGKLKWRTPREDFRRNYSTPVVWKKDGLSQLIVTGTGQVTSYNILSGEFLWSVRRSSRVVSSSPFVGPDGELYVANSGGGEAPDQPSFASLIASSDANQNGRLEKDELPKSIIKNFIDQFDRNKDKGLDESEYESIRATMMYARPVALSIKKTGKGDITEDAVSWTYGKSIPRNASCVLVNGNLFMVRNGGVVTVLDARSGRKLHAGRLRKAGKFYSSPVAGDGKIFACSEDGIVHVISAVAKWKQLSFAELGEDVYATPAISNGRIYIRTTQSLFAFGLK